MFFFGETKINFHSTSYKNSVHSWTGKTFFFFPPVLKWWTHKRKQIRLTKWITENKLLYSSLTSLSPLLCLTEARLMQSCSRSSLGRWSMEVLMGSMERGFFFFSRSGDTNRQNHSVTYNKMHSHNLKKCIKLKLFYKTEGCTCFVFALYGSRGFPLWLWRDLNKM